MEFTKEILFQVFHGQIMNTVFQFVQKAYIMISIYRIVRLPSVDNSLLKTSYPICSKINNSIYI